MRSAHTHFNQDVATETEHGETETERDRDREKSRLKLCDVARTGETDMTTGGAPARQLAAGRS